MPELPEVETTLRGIEPHIHGKTITQVIIRQPKLRWPIADDLAEKLIGQPIISCNRRAKYLLLTLPTGVLLIHLGMSGALRILPAQHSDIDQPSKHDHIDWHFSDGLVMRFRDPRRFGAVLWFEGAPEHHPLLNHLGPEPLSNDFNGAYLHSILVKQKRAIKIALMDNAVVVGVGNIYANESLFRSGIAPNTPANRLTADDCEQLVHQIKAVLQRAIDTGGSTLKDFLHSDGSSGYFQQEYTVYGRQGEPCRQCGTPIEKIMLGQRSSFYCPQCQPLHAD